MHYIKETPIALELELGQKSFGRRHGPKLAKVLQERGFKIGSGGFVVRVKAVEGKASGSLSRKGPNGMQVEPIPVVEYHWRLQDAQGISIWSGKTEGTFQHDRSKYYKGSGKPSNGMAQSEYDFGSNPVQKAIADEIIEQGIGLSVPDDFPSECIFGDGKYGVVPTLLSWKGDKNQMMELVTRPKEQSN